MPDDDKKSDPGATTEPTGLTEDKVRELIAAGVQDAIKDLDTTPQPQPRVQAEDPLDAVLRPRIEKAVAGPLLGALSAADKAGFYNDPVEGDLRRKHMADVEKLFDEGVRSGRAYSRDDWWSYYKGKPENFKKFVDAEVESRGRRVLNAEGEVTVGPGSPAHSGTVRKDPFDMTPEELDKAIGGVSF